MSVLLSSFFRLKERKTFRLTIPAAVGRLDSPGSTYQML